MPSPINTRRFYRRKNGAWVQMRGRYTKVGKSSFPHLKHYSRHSVQMDRHRKARKVSRKKVSRYPHAYD